MVYCWKPGSRYSVDATVAGAVCERLHNDGRLSAQALVDESRDESAPLHGEFEWDNEIAGEAYRRQQACGIINHLIIRIETENKETATVRAFFKVEQESSNYDSIQVICKSEDKRAALERQVLGELQSIREKYSSIAMFEHVWQAIDEVVTV